MLMSVRAANWVEKIHNLTFGAGRQQEYSCFQQQEHQAADGAGAVRPHDALRAADHPGARMHLGAQ